MNQLKTTIRNNQLIHGQFGDITFGPWGLECSDRHAFVTLTDTPRNVQRSENIWMLSAGRLQIDYATQQSETNTLHLQVRFHALDEILLQDGVLRMVFDKTAIKHGVIDNKTILHTDSDKYRLHQTNTVRLVGQNHATITVTLDHADGAGRFDPYLYLRDRADQWIIHARLLPRAPADQVWLRWANRFFTISVPDRLARLLWRITLAQKALWRLRERMGRNWPEIQAVPLNRLKRGQSLTLEVTCHFH